IPTCSFSLIFYATKGITWSQIMPQGDRISLTIKLDLYPIRFNAISRQAASLRFILHVSNCWLFPINFSVLLSQTSKHELRIEYRLQPCENRVPRNKAEITHGQAKVAHLSLT